MTLTWIRNGLLLLALIVSTAAIAAPTDTASRTEIKQMILHEAARTRVPLELALAVAKVESDFNARALSKAGARGVMQIMPKTGRDEFGLTPDELWNARTNIRTGLAYLERLYDQYDARWDLALSHYNGGTLTNYPRDSRPHDFNRGYVRQVLKWQQVYEEQAQIWGALAEASPIDREKRHDDLFGERPPRLIVEPWAEARDAPVVNYIIIDDSYEDRPPPPPRRWRGEDDFYDRPPPRHQRPPRLHRF
ncbi:hypothetical protein JCM17960_16120 [Magnetospira thiophila]